MTKNVVLNALTREKTEKPRELRKDSYIPVVVYGPNVEPRNIKIKNGELEKVYQKAGESSLVDLKINDDEPVKVIFKEIQRNPVKGNFLHADFFQVDMNKKIITEVPLNFIGESDAVKKGGGMMLKNMAMVEIECLPDNLLESIEIDLGKLKNIGDSVKLKDLELPEKVELTSEELTTTIVHVVEPRIILEEEKSDDTSEEEKKDEGEVGEEKKEEDKKE